MTSIQVPVGTMLRKDILTTYWNGPGSTNENFAIDADSRMNLEMSDWYVENGSYVRLKNLTIGYTLPSEWTKKITINNLRFFVAAQNLFTITGHWGLDPEIGEINNSPFTKAVIWDSIRNRVHSCSVLV